MILSKTAVNADVVKAGTFWGFSVVTPAFGAWHVRFRSASSTGPILAESASQLAGATNGSQVKEFKEGHSCADIYVETVSGTNPSIVVYYK